MQQPMACFPLPVHRILAAGATGLLELRVRHLGTCAATAAAALALVGACAAMADPSRPASLGLRVPPGFEVVHFADDDLAHNIYSLTVDAQGHVVAAGPNYVKRLLDDDGDGRADRAERFAELPASGAHGMYFDGPHLICTGDNAVLRLADTDGNGQADGTREAWTATRHSEHGANGVVRGPDGWFWIICGNDAGIGARHAAAPGSPVLEPRCGGVVRFAPDGSTSDVFAHGMRNPYDLDFHPSGALFTVDSDGERDHHLPWYAPTRLFDVAAGMEHGWLAAGWQLSWNRPEAFFDNVERAAELGRGSPTGLLVYRHRAFPPRYHNNIFSACWTLGRVYHIVLQRHGAGFRGTPEVFLETTGETGFAPVDLAVGTAGELYVAVGGRGTRGSVFCVRYKGSQGEAQAPHPATDETGALSQVLTADQPLASWSRARWVPLAQSLGREAFCQVAADPSADELQQVRAVEILVEVFQGIPPDAAREAAALGKPLLTARTAWAISRMPPSKEGTELLAQLTHDSDPWVQRAAWEALAAQPAELIDRLETPPAWLAALDQPGRRVRAATVLAARGSGRRSFERALGRFDPRMPIGRRLAWGWVAGPPAPGDTLHWNAWTEGMIDALLHAEHPAWRLEAVRLIQLALGDLTAQPDLPEVYSGYSGNGVSALDDAQRQALFAGVAAAFPSGQADLDRELARTLAMLQLSTPELLHHLSAQWTADSSPHDDLHYLIVASRLAGERTSEFTERCARALVSLHHKLAARRWQPDRNWPLRVGEMFEQLCQRDPALPAAMWQQPDFGLPEHSLFASLMPPPTDQQAARRLWQATQQVADPARAWTPELVAVVGRLEDEAVREALRSLWEEFALRDAVALVLAARPQQADRALLVEALASPQPQVVRAAATALQRLPAPGSPAEIAQALMALRSYCEAPEERALRSTLAELLKHWSGQPLHIDEMSAVSAARTAAELHRAYAPWFEWFAARHPAEAARLSAPTVDAAAWQQRLAGIDWAAGDPQRGLRVFEKRACHRCHAGSGRLGPSLAGAAARFSRDDLFTAIIDPSKDVAPLYHTVSVVTHDGQSYHGLAVYESSQAVLLQVSAETTLRFAGEEIAAMRPSRQSLMPVGLLNDLTDQDLADLYAYLQTLRKE